MKTILYMAISIDGKITGKDDDTSWVEQEDIIKMNSLMKKCRVMVMGRKTYESFGDELPNDKALQVVLTTDAKVLKTKIKNVMFTNKKIEVVLNELSKNGYKDILIAGGGELNTSLLNQNLIDEIRIIIKPIVIGGMGKSIFNELNEINKFKLKNTEILSNRSVELTFVK